jgi:hypothetical protein
MISVGRANTIPPVEKRIANIYEQQVALQTIIKDFMMIGTGVEKEKAREDLDEKVAFLEESYLEFMEYSELNEKVKTIFEKGSEDWMRLRMIVVDEVNKENASKLVKTNTNLLLLLSDLLAQEKKDDNYVTNETVEKSYEMKIYLDRIAAYYYAYIWGIDREVTVRSMAGALMYFDNLKHFLENNDINSASINGTFTSIENRWVRFKKMSTQLTASKVYVDEYVDLYEEIKSEVNKLPELYSKVIDNSFFSGSKNRVSKDS